MKSEKLFKKYYEPKLLENKINNIVLRTYTHIKGLSTDDPDNSTELIFTPREEVDGRLDSIFSKYGKNKGMAVTSIVSHKNEQKYLFLLDCSMKANKKNDAEITKIIRNLSENYPDLKNSMILKTLNSYHFICFKPFTKDEWQKYMAIAILLRNSKNEPVADIRYIGHSLERGYGSLRISDYLGKPTPDFLTYL